MKRSAARARKCDASPPVERITAWALSLCLCACLESRERRGLNALPASPSVLIRAGWLEASALASTAEAAVGDKEASGSHEKWRVDRVEIKPRNFLSRRLNIPDLHVESQRRQRLELVKRL